MSPTDGMAKGGVSMDRYLAVGRSAVSAIEEALGGRKPERILDFACDHGRVARHLRANFPDAEVQATDLDKAGEDFCVEELGCRRFSGAAAFDDVAFPDPFDLIWSGSLLTHLTEDNALAFLRLAARGLSENGIACLTTHGTFVAGRLSGAKDLKGSIYGLEPAQARRLVEDYFTLGFGFTPYPNNKTYGISVMREDWVREKARECGLQVAAFMPHRWDRHQDVAVFRRLPG